MDRLHNLMLRQLCMIFNIALIGIECVVIWLTLDYYFCFILAVLVITYFVQLVLYVKFKLKKSTKKVDKRKKVE